MWQMQFILIEAYLGHSQSPVSMAVLVMLVHSFPNDARCLHKLRIWKPIYASKENAIDFMIIIMVLTLLNKTKCKMEITCKDMREWSIHHYLWNEDVQKVIVKDLKMNKTSRCVFSYFPISLKLPCSFSISRINLTWSVT